MSPDSTFLTLEEVSRLGGVLDELEEEGVNPKALNIARLWALTGCRRDEIAGLKWPEINFDEGLLELDDSKTGKSIRPLGRAALALLRSIERTSDTEFVLPAERGDGYYQGTKSVWSRAIKKANLPGVTPRTLRHTMGSTSTSTGEALALTGAILGHSNPRSTAIYGHIQTDPSRRAANRVIKKIAAALAGNGGNIRQRKSASTNNTGVGDNYELINLVAQRLTEDSDEARRLRAAIAKAVAGKAPRQRPGAT